MALVNTLTEEELFELHPQLSEHAWPGSADFVTAIEAGFRLLCRDLANAGWDPEKITASDKAFEPLTRLKALSIIFSDFRRQEGDRWDLLARDVKAQYRREIRRVRFDYDRDGDGVVPAGDQNIQIGLEMER